MKKLLFNFFLAGLFMNFGYPELQYQINNLRISGSLAEQLKQIDVNDLVVNANKYFNESGDFVSKEISKSSKIYKENPSPKNSLKDELLSSVNLLKIPGARGKILEESKKHIGVPYSFGSKDPTTGFDCSGYVSYVYQKAINHELPAGSKSQFSQGGGRLVNLDQLKPGDLMFFSHNGKSIQHVGIFIDQDHFIHAPRTGRRISIDDFGRYWKQKFVKGKSYIQ